MRNECIFLACIDNGVLDLSLIHIWLYTLGDGDVVAWRYVTDISG